ncbi:hypothetical protein F3Y22_tig00111366pilonHSYRG00299 [Hibiscus syriacus]|uniref:Reverse transcriptase Ty1/copia-type domain-containing protein n=1 Tax=Hibiscus syriacus TaxID=106335 RepID=A0A6A2YNH2_HIBSY|nr:hypothetical protein F3Y22_tig00111366pilonHSYRG00299 [Hibiscus syriacus]
MWSKTGQFFLPKVRSKERLKKSLYGLKQAPRQWYKKFDSFMSSSGFTICQVDHCCYIKRFDNSFIILLLYVDDMLVAVSDMQEIIYLKQKLSKQFAMKDLGAAKHILGMRIKRNTKSRTLMLSQAEYINKVLFRFNMQDANPVSTPLGVHFRLSKEQSPKTEEERAYMVKVSYASAIGSLMYAMVCTKPDIAQAVRAVSRYMNNPGKREYVDISQRTVNVPYVQLDLRMQTTFFDNVRNAVVFDNPLEDSRSILDRSRRLVELMHKAIEKNEQPQSLRMDNMNRAYQWMPPPEGWYKANTDEARKKTDGKAACGGLIRGLTGEWKLGFKNIRRNMFSYRGGNVGCIHRTAVRMGQRNTITDRRDR